MNVLSLPHGGVHRRAPELPTVRGSHLRDKATKQPQGQPALRARLMGEATSESRKKTLEPWDAVFRGRVKTIQAQVRISELCIRSRRPFEAARPWAKEGAALLCCHCRW